MKKLKTITCHRNHQGFTLIELMITVAIVAILAAVALPAYRVYVVRAQVTEGLLALGASQLNISESFLSAGITATDSTIDSINNGSHESKYISSITASNVPGSYGEITLTFGNNAHALITGSTMIFTPKATQTLVGGVRTVEYVSLDTAGAGGKVDWGCNTAANVTATNRTLGGGNLAGTLGTLPAKYSTSECK